MIDSIDKTTVYSRFFLFPMLMRGIKARVEGKTTYLDDTVVSLKRPVPGSGVVGKRNSGHSESKA